MGSGVWQAPAPERRSRRGPVIAVVTALIVAGVAVGVVVSAASHDSSSPARKPPAPGSSPTTASTAPTDSRAVTGSWADPVSLPDTIMQHAVLLPRSSRVVFWDEGSRAEVLDAVTGVTQKAPVRSNLFCVGHAILSDGRVIAIGGDLPKTAAIGIVDTNIFEPRLNSWSLVAPMHFKRWYPTATKLADGRVLATSGSVDGCLTCFVQTPEIYDPTNDTWTVMAATANADLPWYAYMFVLPDGRVLNAGSTLRPTGTQVLDVATQTWSVVDPRVLDGGSASTYATGKFLKTGSTGDGSSAARPSVSTAYVLDMNAPSPAWRQIDSMEFPRTFHNQTVLPDGNVLVTGGATTSDGIIEQNAVKAAELWSPITEKWTTLASEQVARLYHSVALLLPDGRVLVGGTGRPPTPNKYNYEIFSPPYLFKGPRPKIEGLSTNLVAYNQPFTVTTPHASHIKSISLIAPAAVTHAFDQNARYVPLSFTASGNTLSVKAPVSGGVAPPGPYMLFIVDDQGVPSVATWVTVAA